MKHLISVILAAFLILGLPAAADHHYDANKIDSIESQEKKLVAELTEFLDEYEEAYDHQDYKKVKSMWLDDGQSIYMAEEVPFPLYGRARLDKYFNPVPGRKILDGIDNEYSDIRAKFVAPDVAVATYRLDYDIKLVGMPASGGWDRVMAVFVQTINGWKISAYAEAPMGPMTMARKMMKANPPTSDAEKQAYETTSATLKSLSERSVGEGFSEFLDARKDIEPTH